MLGPIECGPGYSIMCLNGKILHIGYKDSLEGEKLPLIMEIGKKIQVRGIACGYEHTSLWDFEGSFYTWGRSRNGKLGHANQFGVFRENDYERSPRKVVLLDNKCIIGAALGETFTLVLTRTGHIMLIGMMKPLRFGLSNDHDYISPLECEPVGLQKKRVIFVKIESGK